MNIEVRWDEHAIRDLRQLGSGDIEQISRKVAWFCKQKSPLSFATALHGDYQNLFRFRIGDYRIIFEIIHGKPTVLMVLRVKHRREAYR